MRPWLQLHCYNTSLSNSGCSSEKNNEFRPLVLPHRIHDCCLSSPLPTPLTTRPSQKLVSAPGLQTRSWASPCLPDQPLSLIPLSSNRLPKRGKLFTFWNSTFLKTNKLSLYFPKHLPSFLYHSRGADVSKNREVEPIPSLWANLSLLPCICFPPTPPYKLCFLAASQVEIH